MANPKSTICEETCRSQVECNTLYLRLWEAVTVCAVWLVALCGVCGWCQRKLGKRNKPGVETADTPDSARGRGEKKAINDLDRDFWNNNDSSTVQQRWSSYPPKEFVLNISPYAPYGDPRLTLKLPVNSPPPPLPPRSPPPFLPFSTLDSRLFHPPACLLAWKMSGGQKGAASGHGDDGGVPCRNDSVKSMMTGGVKAGRWQTVQGHMQSGGLRPSK
uniref:uncharacterized protein n=1 Tax=Centroberyx gerrardi TaxID=166262 RepID=UPI003AAC8047